MRTARKEHLWIFGFLLLWFGLNLLFLTRYPLVHSDEAWLSGLTRNMLRQGSLSVTEPFFDLKPRFPHAIKILFHLLQMPLITVMGYSVFSVRLLSLVLGSLSLYMFYRCARETVSFPLAFSVTAMVSVNGQFILAAHTARQEIILLFMLLWLMLMLLKSKGSVTPRVAVKLAVVTGLSAGLHPNGILLAAGCGCAMLCLMLIKRRFRFKPLLAYIGITGGIALVFVGISFLFDADFIPHWLRYGDTEFELLVPVSDKFSQVFGYLGRLWNGISGTYTLPYLKPQLVLCAVLVVGGMIQAIRTKAHAPAAALGMVLGGFLATILIGRYNQLSAVLWMFPCLLLLAPLLHKRKLTRMAVAVIAAVFAVTAAVPVRDAYSSDYDAYTAEIGAYVSADTKTLANLNTGFYFDNGKLLDVRNLTYLKENEMTFAEYVESRGIEVIIWSDEMNYIYDHRPDFNVLYGNPRYVPEVEAFFEERCTLLYSFDDPGYGNRIVQLSDTPCIVRIYRVNP